jgi:hypothetical protein
MQLACEILYEVTSCTRHCTDLFLTRSISERNRRNGGTNCDHFQGRRRLKAERNGKGKSGLGSIWKSQSLNTLCYFSSPLSLISALPLTDNDLSPLHSERNCLFSRPNMPFPFLPFARSHFVLCLDCPELGRKNVALLLHIQSTPLCRRHLSICDRPQGGLYCQKTPARSQLNGDLVSVLGYQN